MNTNAPTRKAGHLPTLLRSFLYFDASFTSIYLRDQYGVSKAQPGDLASVCVLAWGLLRLVGGFLADKFGGWRAGAAPEAIEGSRLEAPST